MAKSIMIILPTKSSHNPNTLESKFRNAQNWLEYLNNLASQWYIAQHYVASVSFNRDNLLFHSPMHFHVWLFV